MSAPQRLSLAWRHAWRLGWLGIWLCAASGRADTLAAGDVALTGFNADGSDDFSFLTLVDLPEGETLFFTDNGYNDGALQTGEGTLVWSAPAGGLKAGAVVVVTNVEGAGVPGCDSGRIVELAEVHFAASGDQWLIYKTNGGATNFIFALSTSDKDWDQRAVSPNENSEVPPGLVAGRSAIHTTRDLGAIMNIDCGRFSGDVVATKGECQCLLSTRGLWEFTDSGPLPLSSADATVLTPIASQGFENSAADTWGIASGAAVTSDVGVVNVPSNQIVRSGACCQQTINAYNTLILDWVRVDAYTSVVATVHLSAGGSSEYTGVESNDAVKVFAALDGGAFGNIPDIVVVGRVDCRWSYSEIGAVTFAGTPIIRGPGGSGNRDDNGDGYSRLVVRIPDGTSRVRLMVVSLNNAATERWNIDDITLDGLAVRRRPGTVFFAH